MDDHGDVVVEGAGADGGQRPVLEADAEADQSPGWWVERDSG
ncbi:hypothetical protein [Streptomyces sp. RB110-1]